MSNNKLCGPRSTKKNPAYTKAELVKLANEKLGMSKYSANKLSNEELCSKLKISRDGKVDGKSEEELQDEKEIEQEPVEEKKDIKVEIKFYVNRFINKKQQKGISIYEIKMEDLCKYLKKKISDLEIDEYQDYINKRISIYIKNDESEKILFFVKRMFLANFGDVKMFKVSSIYLKFLRSYVPFIDKDSYKPSKNFNEFLNTKVKDSLIKAIVYHLSTIITSSSESPETIYNKYLNLCNEKANSMKLSFNKAAFEERFTKIKLMNAINLALKNKVEDKKEMKKIEEVKLSPKEKLSVKKSADKIPSAKQLLKDYTPKQKEPVKKCGPRNSKKNPAYTKKELVDLAVLKLNMSKYAANKLDNYKLCELLRMSEDGHSLDEKKVEEKPILVEQSEDKIEEKDVNEAKEKVRLAAEEAKKKEELLSKKKARQAKEDAERKIREAEEAIQKAKQAEKEAKKKKEEEKEREEKNEENKLEIECDFDKPCKDNKYCFIDKNICVDPSIYKSIEYIPYEINAQKFIGTEKGIRNLQKIYENKVIVGEGKTEEGRLGEEIVEINNPDNILDKCTFLS